MAERADLKFSGTGVLANTSLVTCILAGDDGQDRHGTQNME